MPGPRKPTAILEATGAYIKNPQRRRPPEPRPVGPLGTAPEHLGDREKTIWDELSSLLPPGVAGSCDEPAFEVIVCLLSQFRHNRSTMSGSLLMQLSNLLGKFGMTPSSRASLSIPPTNQADPLQDFLHGERKTQ
jgi:hypothetical protein